MGSRLYVGNLSYSTTESQLKDLFEVHGEIASVAIVLDRMSGRSRGFGFVEFASESDAQKAIEAMHGSEVDGRTLTVNEAREDCGWEALGDKLGDKRYMAQTMVEVGAPPAPPPGSPPNPAPKEPNIPGTPEKSIQAIGTGAMSSYGPDEGRRL